MLESLSIKNFKCFESLQVDGLKLVNVVVGLNNSGKSSLLEGIHFLKASNPIVPLREALGRRGLISMQPQQVSVDPSGMTAPPKGGDALDVIELFHGRTNRSRPRPHFELVGHQTSGRSTVTRCVYSQDDPWLHWPFDQEKSRSIRMYPPETLWFEQAESADADSPRRSNFAELGFSNEKLAVLALQQESERVRHLGVGGLDINWALKWWAYLQERNLNRSVCDSMNLLSQDPVSEVYHSFPFWVKPPLPRSLFRVRFASDTESPVPISSLGEGSFRLFGLAISLIGPQRLQLVLIDEIDTGLHYTVLPDMWKMVGKTAAARDVQLFATTHSYDCLKGLAEAARENPELASEIAIVHLNAQSKKATTYSIEEWEALDGMGADVRGTKPRSEKKDVKSSSTSKRSPSKRKVGAK